MRSCCFTWKAPRSSWRRAAAPLAAVLLFAVAAVPARSAETIVSGNYKVWQAATPTTAERVAYRQQLYDGVIRDDAAFDRVVQWKFSELTSEEHLFELPKLRKQLRYDLTVSGKAGSRAAHDRINALAMAHLPAIVADRAYHHGTRLAALLLLGELNAVEERTLEPAAPAAPLAEVLPLLVDWLEPAADGGATQDLLPAGALVGLIRHARLGIADSEVRQRALDAALALAEQKQPPAHRSAEGHDWLRRRAIQLLAALVQPGRTPADDRAIAWIWGAIDDGDGSLKLQVEAALAFCTLSPRPPADGYPAPQSVRKLVQLAARAVRSELSLATSEPEFVRRQSRRVVAARLGAIQAACSQLGIDAAAAKRSPPPAELTTPDQLYRGLMEWIGQASNPRWDSLRAAEALAESLPLLDKYSAAAAEP